MEHLYFEPWKISLDHIPDELEIHAEVIMHQLISYTGDGFPRDIWVGILEGGGEAFCGFAMILRLRITASCVFRSAKKPSLPDVV